MRGSNQAKWLSWLLRPFRAGTVSHQPDLVLLTLSGLVIFFGLLMLSSATSVTSFDRYGDSYYFLKQQLTRGFLPGLLGFLIFIRWPYEKLKKFGWLWLLLTIGLLLLVFIPGLGIVINNARSWINIGSITIQTSEIAKLTFIIYLAIWLESKQKHLTDYRNSLLPFIILLAIVAGLILLQPDVGTLLVFLLVASVMFFTAGAPWRYLAVFGGLGLASLAVLVTAAPYRFNRLLSFLNPNVDPQGFSYQLKQALIAVGSGGLWGLGLGHSQQKFQFLPEVATDSIFAIIAEEWCFIATGFLVVVYLMIFLRGLRIAKQSDTMFGKLLAVGITGWLILQSLINIGAIIGLLPLTGLPLTFVSLGGSNLVVVMIALAILLNISKYTKPANE